MSHCSITEHLAGSAQSKGLNKCECVLFFVLQKQGPQPTPVKPVVKKENQWFDVGIVKVTNMVVTHFYVPADESQGDVSASGSFFHISNPGCGFAQ